MNNYNTDLKNYKRIWGFGEEACAKRDNLEQPGVDERTILRCIFRKWDGGMDWIELVQGRYMWRAIVKAVMNLRVL